MDEGLVVNRCVGEESNLFLLLDQGTTFRTAALGATAEALRCINGVHSLIAVLLRRSKLLCQDLQMIHRQS